MAYRLDLAHQQIQSSLQPGHNQSIGSSHGEQVALTPAATCCQVSVQGCFCSTGSAGMTASTQQHQFLMWWHQLWNPVRGFCHSGWVVASAMDTVSRFRSPSAEPDPQLTLPSMYGGSSCPGP